MKRSIYKQNDGFNVPGHFVCQYSFSFLDLFEKKIFVSLISLL